MKMLLGLLLLGSISAYADETCETNFYDFRITNSYIESYGNSGTVRLPYTHMRSLSINNLGDFKALIHSLSDEITTDGVLTSTEISRLTRFSITVADGAEELVSLKYIKGFDKSGILMLRYMITDGGTLRCL
jgi:hypothetical protein